MLIFSSLRRRGQSVDSYTLCQTKGVKRWKMNVGDSEQHIREHEGFHSGIFMGFIFT